MSRVGVLYSLLWILLSCGCGSRPVLTTLQDPVLVDIPVTESTQPVMFTKAVIKLRRGQVIGEIQSGPLCLPESEMVWRGGSRPFWDEEVQDIFRDEMQRANITVVGDREKLFGDPMQSAARYYVAALVRDFHHNVCRPNDYLFDSASRTSEASIKVEWQVFSLFDKKMVATIPVRGTARIDSPRDTADMDSIYEAFAQAVRFLIADPTFQALVRDTPEHAPRSRKAHDAGSTGLRPIVLVGQSDSSSVRVPLAEVRERVVTIDSGAAIGSGFFISEDGLVLTNQHVVGSSKDVRIRLISGVEITGSVVRTNVRRDVALIQADLTKTPCLPLAMSSPEIGAPVYAIGSPGGTEREGSVSCGVISAIRHQYEQDYIQSDVGVTHGSSGGPLIDVDGHVVALTVAGDEKATSVNYFIPILDATRVLNLVHGQELPVPEQAHLCSFLPRGNTILKTVMGEPHAED
ncbi:S1C family serine protease [Desulfovibrio inopinatus]|uniref:S1C family serine protease n=1 Tax=Desulfovibrio inopinatus TaxID=102109 RepID=UPI00040C86E2|nr:S1C family serine protease [Desulfovibrio inopinatus]